MEDLGDEQMAKTMKMAEIIKTPEWARLSAHQKMFLETYLPSNDKNFATCAAYNAQGESARVLSYKILKERKVIAVLNKFHRKNSRQLFAEQLLADVEASKSGSLARARLRALYAHVAFGTRVSKSRKDFLK